MKKKNVVVKQQNKKDYVLLTNRTSTRFGLRLQFSAGGNASNAWGGGVSRYVTENHCLTLKIQGMTTAGIFSISLS